MQWSQYGRDVILQLALMTWTFDLCPEAEAELLGMPTDIRARFLHIADLLESFGPLQVGMPHVRHLDGKLWEMRMAGPRRHCPGRLRGPHGAAVDRPACLHQEDPEGATQGAGDRPRPLAETGR
jgi:hypothetical protein